MTGVQTCALPIFQLHEKRHRMMLQWEAFFQQYDFLLCPTATTVAFAHNQQGERWERMLDVNGHPQPSTTQLFWAGFSGMAYLPSTVVPAGLTASGMPSGVQIIGPSHGDMACIDFAQRLENEYMGFLSPPYFD